jgi:hypothetical protein
MTEKIAVILSKDRKASPGQEALRAELLRELERRAELDVTVLPHLHDLAPDGPSVQRLRAISGDLIVLAWLYPRSTYWVLDAHGVRGRLGRTTSMPEEDADEPPPSRHGKRVLPDRTLWCFDLRTHDRPEAYLAAIERIASHKLGKAVALGEAIAAEGSGEAAVLGESTRPRWYPVVDFDRCNDCLECLNFCLFGVYGLDAAGAITVEQPDACRPGCPACARVCPQAAIIFPQHNDPAIAGDPRASLAGLKLDLSQLLSGISPSDLAAAERQRAAAEPAGQQAQPMPTPTPAEAQPSPRPEGAGGRDPLDSLIDGLENMDL